MKITLDTADTAAHKYTMAPGGIKAAMIQI